MTPLDGLKAASLLFVAAILQVTIVSTISIAGGAPDLVLVVLLSIALLRGSVVGAGGGFFVGLILDTATLGTLGLTSFVLTLVGYWVGRYGETTGRDRGHAPFVSVGVGTLLATVSTLLLHSMLGAGVAVAAVLASLPASVALNLLLTPPLHRLVRRIVQPPEWSNRAREVRLLG